MIHDHMGICVMGIIVCVYVCIYVCVCVCVCVWYMVIIHGHMGSSIMCVVYDHMGSRVMSCHVIVSDTWSCEYVCHVMGIMVCDHMGSSVIICVMWSYEYVLSWTCLWCVHVCVSTLYHSHVCVTWSYEVLYHDHGVSCVHVSSYILPMSYILPLFPIFHYSLFLQF